MAIHQIPLLCLSAAALLFLAAAAGPTDGFVEQQNIKFKIDKPFDLSEDRRYSLIDGVHRMFVLKTDKPLKEGSSTLPRTELRALGFDYTTGIYQFEADFFVVSPSTGMSVMQVFGGTKSGSATALMLHVKNGDLIRFGGNLRSKTVATGIYNRWIHINVIHNADKKTIEIWLDGKLVHTENNESNNNHYFKFGVYTQRDASERMESRWRNVKVWKKE